MVEPVEGGAPPTHLVESKGTVERRRLTRASGVLTWCKQVPNIVDFDGDLSLLEGSVWKDRLGLKKEHMSAIFETVLPPILNKVGVKLGTPDLGKRLCPYNRLWPLSDGC